MNRAKRTDANHTEIVDLFRKMGCLVWDTSGWGGGFPDLIVQRRHPHTGQFETYLVEIKDGTLSPSRRRLNALQQAFHSVWHCHVVESPEDVIELLRVNVI